MKSAIIDLMAGARLDEARAEAVLDAVMDGQATPAQIGALLVALRSRGETVTELTGFARSMRTHVTTVLTTRRPLLDTCGTGGGGLPTINVSTAAALVAAGAGLAVAKHGNRAMTSKCGSADVVAALGINLQEPPERVGRCIDEVGIGFLFAPDLHPAMRHAVGPRREIGIRSAFNLLGPLTNPAGAECQVIGVPDPDLVGLLLEVLARLGCHHALIVHGLAGVDELSLEGPSIVGELRDGWTRKTMVTPAEVDLREAPLAAVRGGNAAQNAAAIEAILAGETGPRRDFVLFNAAAAIVAGDGAETLREGVELARRSLDSGAAKAILEAWRAFQAAS